MSRGSKDMFKNASGLILILIWMPQIWQIMEWLKTLKLEYLENRTELFYKIKKILTCALDDTL